MVSARIDKQLAEDARALAQRRGCTLTDLIATTLRGELELEPDRIDELAVRVADLEEHVVRIERKIIGAIGQGSAAA